MALGEGEGDEEQQHAIGSIGRFKVFGGLNRSFSLSNFKLLKIDFRVNKHSNVMTKEGELGFGVITAHNSWSITCLYYDQILALNFY